MRVLLIAGLVLASVVISDELRAQPPDLTSGYLCNGQCGSGNACATIAQKGLELTIVDPRGRQATGRFLNNYRIAFGDLVGAIEDDAVRIVWNNGTFWIRTTLCPSP